MLFPQSPSLRALFVVVFVDDDPVSFCICWKICLKGNKNPNLGCPLRWLRVPCGCGRRGDSQLADWVAGLGTAAPRGYWGWEGLQGSSSPRLSWSPGAPWNSHSPGLWDFPLHQYWLEIWSCRNWDGTGAAASHLLLLRAAGMEDGALNSMLILT